MQRPEAVPAAGGSRQERRPGHQPPALPGHSPHGVLLHHPLLLPLLLCWAGCESIPSAE